ncbi:GPI-anchored surface protein, putative [Bodo saltans]|uniref:GPI-anchored surface protein, putative n=1 Tax=Bodo saltans TaxID=75058 RepID=A0A0S4JJG6_BODSA|nr:GPI-anchored surface protein, putative [Bodo saltans]|eukprot:CUG89158.1 GPI-anchored surface protein, putative [Bodo saltans]
MSSDREFVEAYKPRSEEDQIRRSVFSRCLRLLATASPEQKVKWGLQVQEIIDAEVAKKSKAAAKRPRSEDQVPAPQATLTENSPMAPNAEDKPIEEVERQVLSQGDVVVFAADVTTIEDLERLSGSATATTPLLTPADATAIVGSYMRQLLDRVVGLSLNVFSTAALSFLCVMLSITSKPPKGKDALYSLLANFHYQECEKIGKRQINNRTVLLHAQQDAAAFASANKKPAPKKGSAQKTVTTTAPAPMESLRVSSRRAGKSNPIAEEVVEEDAALELRDETPAFTKVQRPKGKVVFRADEDHPAPIALDDIALNRKVMTLVQVLDPVTIDTLFKKLNDNNNSDGAAATDRHRIERALMTLASQGVLFYENEIAYFAG